jgi:hypothetical protein
VPGYPQLPNFAASILLPFSFSLYPLKFDFYHARHSREDNVFWNGPFIFLKRAILTLKMAV